RCEDAENGERAFETRVEARTDPAENHEQRRLDRRSDSDAKQQPCDGPHHDVAANRTYRSLDIERTSHHFESRDEAQHESGRGPGAARKTRCQPPDVSLQVDA